MLKQPKGPKRRMSAMTDHEMVVESDPDWVERSPKHSRHLESRDGVGSPEG